MRKNHPQTPLLELLRQLENDAKRDEFATLCGTSRGYLYQLSICGRRSCRVDLAQRIADASVQIAAKYGTPTITVQVLATMCANAKAAG